MLKTIMNSSRGLATRTLVLGLALLTSLGSVSAQSNSDRSPYSRYGYGTFASPTTAGSRAMGGLSYGLRDGLIASPTNPASYTAVDSLTFIMDVGVSAHYATLSSGSASDTRLLGNLEYATLLFPLGGRMAMSAGIMPLTHMGYSFGTTDTMGGDTNSTEYLRRYRGSGGYNSIYLGLAGRTFGGLHLGINGAFILGNTQRTNQASFSTSGAYNPVDTYRLRLNGFKVDLGVQYELALDSASKRRLVIGASVTPGYGLTSELIHTRQGVASSGNVEVLASDTITSGKYTMPLTVGAGVSYRIVDKLMVGADVKYSKWTEASYESLEATFQDQWSVALGTEWIPDSRARNPWHRSKYRFGLSGGNSYLQVPNPSGSLAGYYELGASLGISFPLVDRRSALNVSFEYKHLSPRSSGMVSERYIGATIGVVFNESWFRKARVN